MKHATLAFIGGGNMASCHPRAGCAAPAARPTHSSSSSPGRSSASAWPPAFGIEALPVPAKRLCEAPLVVWAVKPQLFDERGTRRRALHRPRAAAVRHGRRDLRTHRRRQWQRARGARHAQHAGTDRPGHRRPGRHAGGQRLGARRGRGGAGPHRPPAVAGARGAARHRDRAVGLGAGLLPSTSARPGRGRQRPRPERCAGARAGAGHLWRAAALALQSPEPLATLRERVTSKGGTTHAALESLRADGVAEALQRAVRAAAARAAELGRA
jgi:pyrroline-5-carboxylate reductase